jgi:hypothetical protein
MKIPNPKSMLAGGLVAVAAGFVLLLLSWGQAAGADDVTDQVPWVVAGSGIGVAVVATGLVLLNVATRAQEAGEVDRQLQRLLAALEAQDGEAS